MYINITSIIEYIVGEDEYLQRLSDFNIPELISKIKEKSNYSFNEAELVCKIGKLYRKVTYDFAEENQDAMNALWEAEMLLKDVFIGKRCMELGLEFDKNYFEQLNEKELKHEIEIFKEYLPIKSRGFEFWRFGKPRTPFAILLEQAEYTMNRKYNNDYGEL